MLRGAVRASAKAAEGAAAAAPAAAAGGGPGGLLRVGLGLAAGAGICYVTFGDEGRGSSAYHALFTGVVMRGLRLVDPETAHGIGIRAAQLAPADTDQDDPRLAVTIPEWGGATFSNPIGLAAGFDKQGEAMGPMLKAGFGFVEVGTVTPRPQPGNPKPRMFRLVEDRAVINRYGFNSDGADSVSERVAAFRAARTAGDAPSPPKGVAPLGPAAGGPIALPASASGDATVLLRDRVLSGMVGMNVGKNKTTEDAAEDYTIGVETFAPLADYLVVNVSSPNTPGLRDLQRRDQLKALLDAAVAARARAAARADPSGAWGGPPLLVKIAPDVTDSELDDMVAVSLSAGVDGIVVSNTTIDRPDTLRSEHRAEGGGLSGEPVRAKSTDVLRKAYALTRGRIPLVGVGGVSSGQHAYDKIRAGATLVQVYTALAYEGPPLVRRVKRELAALLERDGFASVQEAVGADVKPAEAPARA